MTNPLNPTGGGTSPGATPIGSTNPDGTINYGGILANGGSGSTSAPVDSSGSIDVWNLPSWLTGPNAPKIWFDTGHSSQSGTHFGGPASGEDRTKVNVGKPHSFDINLTAEQVMKQFAAMSQTDPMGFASVQKQLADAGFYDSAAHVYGGWNAQTETALASAMVQYLKVANGAGVPVSFRDFLTHQAVANVGINGNTGPGGGGSGGASTANVALTDPDTLAMYAQKAAQSALGRALKPSEIQSFVDQFHQQQIAAFGEGAAAGTQIVDKNDPRASAINFVTQNNKQEFGQHQISGYTDAFLNMFLPQSSQAPNTNVDPSAVGY